MREPNKAILDTGVPIPKAEDIRAELHVFKIFSKLDFRTAFHQLELDEESRYLTVFAPLRAQRQVEAPHTANHGCETSLWRA